MRLTDQQKADLEIIDNWIWCGKRGQRIHERVCQERVYKPHSRKCKACVKERREGK